MRRRCHGCARASPLVALGLAALLASPGLCQESSGGVGAPLRTRHATLSPTDFKDLPGWRDDDVASAWGAFRASCGVLRARPGWDAVCASAAAVPVNSGAVRAFFESQFFPLRIGNADASLTGTVTGYFEPLLEGRRRREAGFEVPVLGLPADLYTLDWASIPPPARQGVVRLRAKGRVLELSEPAEPATALLDLSQFTLDTRDRRLRLRLDGEGASRKALPYHDRAEIHRHMGRSGSAAPVLAWVRHPLSHYAMQIQGSGRIRFPDGQILRLGYAEQNGHAFRPFRIAARSGDAVLTRSIGGANLSEDEFEFVAADMLPSGEPVAASGHESGVVSRGVRAAQPGARRGSDEPPARAVEQVIEVLLGRGAIQPAPRPSPAASGQGGSRSSASSSHDAGQAERAVSSADVSALQSRLEADPSFVFFKPLADQSEESGPPGALGVALTAGRSVAVDPRVTPLGYPVFLATAQGDGPQGPMQRLVMAQDTGGAIRGAVRADYFWGFGRQAGELARRTNHVLNMWLLVPKTLVATLNPAKVMTRSIGGAASDSERECVLPDAEHCVESN
jgi:membrane-bound lytic murein transglycosylase A